MFFICKIIKKNNLAPFLWDVLSVDNLVYFSAFLIHRMCAFALIYNIFL